MKNEDKNVDFLSGNEVQSFLPKFANEMVPQNVTSIRRKALKSRYRTIVDDYDGAELPSMAIKASASVLEKKENKRPASRVEPKVAPVKKKGLTKKKMAKAEKMLSYMIASVLVLMAVYCGSKVGLWGNENDDVDRQMTEVQDLVVERIVEDRTPVADSFEIQNTANTNQKTDYGKLALVDVDFSKLKKVNADTVAYIKIDGLDVNAPVVQTSDNDYYLEHSFDKSANSAGWIFGDFRNDWTNLKANTIVYGHNRKNYTMFGSLKLILEQNWPAKNKNCFVYVSTETENMVFEMFSAYNIPTTSDYLQNEFDTKEEYGTFLDMLKNRSEVDFEAKPSEDDKIITLSTCYTNTSKTVVHAKLVKSQKK